MHRSHDRSIVGGVLGSQLVVVSDAHLGAGPKADDEAFVDFLDRVPALGDCLLVNGDLFDFWFSYERVVPRASFKVTAALASLRRKIPIVMTGGNHDRWGNSFWQEDANITFSPGELRFRVGDREVLAIHGDGIGEPKWSARFLQRTIRHPVISSLYRLLHPDFGLWLVNRVKGVLADKTRDPALLERAERHQAEWGKARLIADTSLNVLIMAHTHRPYAEQLPSGQWFLNPGAWIGDHRYAVVSAEGVRLDEFTSQ